MKVLIISGFLGAGKTTFIRHLTDRLRDIDFAIFENEFGETDIDAKLLRGEDHQLKVYEMTENCVCCTGKADFLTNLVTISSALDPDVLIVEPTGAARLGAIRKNIEALHYDHIRLLPSLTLVDAHTFFREKDRYDEIRLDQIRNASLLVLSKSENLPERELEWYAKALRELNPHACILTGDYTRQEEGWWRRLVTGWTPGSGVPDGGQEPDQSHHHVHLDTVTVEAAALPNPVSLMNFLILVTAGVFGQIPRAKGYLPCGLDGQWLRFDLVETEWMLSGFPPQEHAAVTLIGTGIDRDGVHRYLMRS